MEFQCIWPKCGAPTGRQADRSVKYGFCTSLLPAVLGVFITVYLRCFYEEKKVMHVHRRALNPAQVRVFSWQPAVEERSGRLPVLCKRERA